VKYPSWLIFLTLVPPLAGCHGQQGNSIDDAPAVTAEALKSAADDPGVRTFYAAEAWQPVWSKDA
jgi:hypothetical protein